ncbi:hypothetical protein M153_9350003563 [Pseudoloma neurophilia]|uniref:Uncharacterized protein n=1 Tax=Pseudoloma neurophilia TaxID=146866 RepID=A0A0R0M1U3_9MICR|nr:hypothetical protein M153_9350003563 [Pseudoloma neurophilia]
MGNFIGLLKYKTCQICVIMLFLVLLNLLSIGCKDQSQTDVLQELDQKIDTLERELDRNEELIEINNVKRENSGIIGKKLIDIENGKIRKHIQRLQTDLNSAKAQKENLNK